MPWGDLVNLCTSLNPISHLLAKLVVIPETKLSARPYKIYGDFSCTSLSISFSKSRNTNVWKQLGYDAAIVACVRHDRRGFRHVGSGAVQHGNDQLFNPSGAIGEIFRCFGSHSFLGKRLPYIKEENLAFSTFIPNVIRVRTDWWTADIYA